MAYQCKLCGKKIMSGNNVSHSNRHTRTKWMPNLQKVKAVLNGVTKKILVCTTCIKSGKVEKPKKRNYQKTSA